MVADSTTSKLESSSENLPLETHSLDHLTSTSAPPSTNYVGLTDLPTELYLKIFESIRPAFSLLHRRASTSISQWDQIKAHRQGVRQYADLRLICSRLNDVLTPIVYREMVITIDENTRKRLASAFECGAAHLRRLIIFGYQSSYGDAAVVGHGLSLCSQLETIECYGHHCTFTKRGWLARTAPNVISTVTSLVFSPDPDGTGVDLSYCLLELGAHLQSLEIQDWDWRSNAIGFPFHLPSKMPHLTHLLLRGGRPNVEDVKKLITRATETKTPESSALRSFSMINVRDIDDMMPILSINNLCSRLTVLHWRPYWPEFQDDDVISVVKACPNLVDFSYTKSFHKDIFHHLPPALEHLELSLLLKLLHGSNNVEVQYCSSGDDFVMYLKSERCRALRTLTVLKEHNDGFSTAVTIRKFDVASLVSACDDIGVSLQVSSSPLGWDPTGHTSSFPR
jgi:hypothetical protein